MGPPGRRTLPDSHAPSPWAARSAGLARPGLAVGRAAALLAEGVAVGVALLGEQLLVAVGADAVGELRVGARGQVRFDLAPVAAVVADLLAPGADRKQARQDLELADRLLDPLVELGGADAELAHAQQRDGDDREGDRGDREDEEPAGLIELRAQLNGEGVGAAPLAVDARLDDEAVAAG